MASHRSLLTPSRLLAGLLTGLLAGLLSACGQSASDGKAAREAPPAPVTLTQVAVETVPLVRSGIGTVLPVASVTVRARVDGQLERVDFKEGQDVKAGQVLVHLDPRTLQAQLEQIQAQKAKDEALLANAQADLQRYTALIKDEATTQQTLDTQRALVTQLAATLKNDDAQINFARVQLGFTTIAAPISGRIGARLVDPGNIVHAADVGGLLVINQIDPVAVQFTLPEASFQAVNQALHASGKPLKVEAIDRETRQLLGTGELVLLNNQIDTTTGTIVLKAHFANPAHRLWPGQSIDARVTLGAREDVLTVPTPVVQRGQEGYFVYAVDADNRVRVQPVKVGISEGGKMVIDNGLNAGERVVLDGQYRLTSGVRVAETKAAKPGGQGGAKPAGADASAPAGSAASAPASAPSSAAASGAQPTAEAASGAKS